MEFEVITSDQRRLEFMAGSIQERDEWVQLIGQEIGKALGAQQAESKDGRLMASKAETDEIFHIPGNDRCADCGHREAKWASINLGVVLCIECSGERASYPIFLSFLKLLLSGVHRKLGSHFSKVRSLELDQWPCEYVEILKRVGNQKANAVWEKTLTPNSKIEPNSQT